MVELIWQLRLVSETSPSIDLEQGPGQMDDLTPQALPCILTLAATSASCFCLLEASMHHSLRARFPGLVAVLFILVLAPVGALAQCTAPNVCIPQPTCAYTGTSVIAYPPSPALIRNLELSTPTSCQPPAPPNGSVNSFFDVFVDLQISTDNGGSWQPASGTAHGEIHAMTEPSGTIIDTEMLQLDLSGVTTPPGVKLRESPSQTSPGQESFTPQGGQFQINSFFDIFTELSLDNGQTWIPPSGPNQETITQSSPTPTHEETWGELKATYR
jgi:hypothetical protein